MGPAIIGKNDHRARVTNGAEKKEVPARTKKTIACVERTKETEGGTRWPRRGQKMGMRMHTGICDELCVLGAAA